MLVKILIGIVVVIGVFAIVVATRPSHFTVSRSATIGAAPAVVFPHVNDLHKWQAWSPWAKKDPNAKTTFEGPETGVGSVFHWDGNNDVGAGAMTVLESVPNEKVKFRLDFEKPFKGTNTAEFNFKPDGDKTNVSWSMSGENNFIFKAVGLFMDCDKMVGGDFEKGLADLKTLSEAEAKK